jgi:hypothetical protein
LGTRSVERARTPQLQPLWVEAVLKYPIVTDAENWFPLPIATGVPTWIFSS